MTPAERIVSFSSGANALFGIVHEGAHESDTGIVILVGGPQYRVGSHRMFVQIARTFASQGYPVLRFDYAGMGDSEGKFAGFEHLDPDIRAAVETLVREVDGVDRVALIGLCDGATAAAYYAPKDSRVHACVMLNPWVHTELSEARVFLWRYYPRRVLQRDFWRRLFSGRIPIGQGLRDFFRGLARVVGLASNARDSEDGQDFVERLREALTRFDGASMVVLSERDYTAAEFTDLWDNDSTWEALRRSISSVSLAGADHTLSARQDLIEFCRTVAAWLGKMK